MNEKKINQNSFIRLDNLLVKQRKFDTRSQAENYIKLGYVKVNGRVTTKPGQKLQKNSVVNITAPKKFVSRAGLKLYSVINELELNFRGKNILDVGSSTGGFTDLALQHGATKVIAVDVGTKQMKTVLKMNKKVELHEQTDIRDMSSFSTMPDIVLIDVSFISIRQILSHLLKTISRDTLVVAMVKPQFETDRSMDKSNGVVKNDTIRRKIFKDFELHIKTSYKSISKADSKVRGEKGNLERFYLLKLLI